MFHLYTKVKIKSKIFCSLGNQIGLSIIDKLLDVRMEKSVLLSQNHNISENSPHNVVILFFFFWKKIVLHYESNVTTPKLTFIFA